MSVAESRSRFQDLASTASNGQSPQFGVSWPEAGELSCPRSAGRTYGIGAHDKRRLEMLGQCDERRCLFRKACRHCSCGGRSVAAALGKDQIGCPTEPGRAQCEAGCPRVVLSPPKFFRATPGTSGLTAFRKGEAVSSTCKNRRRMIPLVGNRISAACFVAVANPKFCQAKSV